MAKAGGGLWRNVASLNSDKVTYTTVGPALNISDKTGTGSEASGTYRCIVTALRSNGSLAGSVTSATADVDPTPEPLEGIFWEVAHAPAPERYYFYHTSYIIPEYTDETTGQRIQEETNVWVRKNWMTLESYRESTRPRKVLRVDWKDSYYNVDEESGRFLTFDRESPIFFQDENGDWYWRNVYDYCYDCRIKSLSGGKGPYTLHWYLSKDRFGSSVDTDLIEGVNCQGQGTQWIILWPGEEMVGKGDGKPVFLGFLVCKVTDAMGRTKIINYHKYTISSGVEYHGYKMFYALNDSNLWWSDANKGAVWSPYKTSPDKDGAWW